jgi:hypothetical protein
MYLTHCYDVLSGVTKDVRQSSYLDEPYDARSIVRKLERNSITLYDRLYISCKMIETHKRKSSHFVMRARRSSSKTVRKFFKSDEVKKRCRIGQRMVTLIKSINPKTGDVAVYVTDLNESWITPDAVHKLYMKRWEVEISFKELSDTMKAEQWHSKTLNGILQEFYTLFWLMNYTKIQIQQNTQNPENHLGKEYYKPNFKFILTWIKDKLRELFKGKRKVLDPIKALIKLSTQRRVHNQRHYARVVKSPRSHYKYMGQVWEIPA